MEKEGESNFLLEWWCTLKEMYSILWERYILIVCKEGILWICMHLSVIWRKLKTIYYERQESLRILSEREASCYMDWDHMVSWTCNYRNCILRKRIENVRKSWIIGRIYCVDSCFSCLKSFPITTIQLYFGRQFWIETIRWEIYCNYLYLNDRTLSVRADSCIKNYEC